MKLSILVSSLSLTFACAAPSSQIAKRDENTAAIQTAILRVATASTDVDAAIRALTPSPMDAQRLVFSIFSLETALTQARTDILPTQPVSIIDNSVVQSAVDTMVKSYKILVLTSILHRSATDQVKLTSDIFKTYMNQRQLSAVLVQALVTKIPAENVAATTAAFDEFGATLAAGIGTLGSAPVTASPSQASAPKALPLTAHLNDSPSVDSDVDGMVIAIGDTAEDTAIAAAMRDMDISLSDV
ncbi:hypothetical protein LY78DRAFT_726506 [Colletotrichum sublineola]|uniref:Cell wall protein n=1 Tax=Colletotrichum sublineola TaxID=1173701 RepID=A0A066WXZ3_COLSU|nr:hypothetical protein LY78DRAFT_726506 [Colletotrichum sublineola]KDN60284.1 hypothetical protein CSUB01_09769 [Colletotrichum sublineola]